MCTKVYVYIPFVYACFAANPSPTVVWNKDGKLLKSDSHVSIFESEGQYYLEIHRAAAEDAGEYTCTASNSEGSVSCSVAVFVESRCSMFGVDEGDVFVSAWSPPEHKWVDQGMGTALGVTVH